MLIWVMCKQEKNLFENFQNRNSVSKHEGGSLPNFCQCASYRNVESPEVVTSSLDSLQPLYRSLTCKHFNISDWVKFDIFFIIRNIFSDRCSKQCFLAAAVLLVHCKVTNFDKFFDGVIYFIGKVLPVYLVSRNFRKLKDTIYSFSKWMARVHLLL